VLAGPASRTQCAAPGHSPARRTGTRR
jgi:hypothetical protein